MEQLSDLKDIATSLQTPMDGDRVAACEAATDILNALQDEGIKDPEQVRDLIHDYNALAEQYQAMHRKYEEPAKPQPLGEFSVCPECHRQIAPKDSFCWNCGKRLGWR